MAGQWSKGRLRLVACTPVVPSLLPIDGSSGRVDAVRIRSSTSRLTNPAPEIQMIEADWEGRGATSMLVEGRRNEAHGAPSTEALEVVHTYIDVLVP
jgi:hypothetical protein